MLTSLLLVAMAQAPDSDATALPAPAAALVAPMVAPPPAPPPAAAPEQAPPPAVAALPAPPQTAPLIVMTAPPPPLPPLEGSDDPDLGPYLRGSWGLGFRLLGEAPQLMVRYALSDRVATGLDLSWYGQTLTSAGRSRRLETAKPTTSKPGNIDSSRIDLQIAIPLENAFGRRGPLCGIVAFGPFVRVQQSEIAWNEDIYTGEVIAYQENRLEIHVGLQAALGARWEIAQDVVLASEFGVRGWGIGGDYENTTDYPDGIGYADFSETGDLSGMGSEAWFGGIGLDVWF